MPSREHRRPRRCRWLGPATLLAALLPTLPLAYQALGERDSTAGYSQRSRRQRVLAQIPSNPAVLINVKQRDMPASPDILELGKRSTAALERCLADNVDASLRNLCAVMLEALGDRRALGTLQAALDDWDSGVRRRAVSALGVIPDPSSVNPLIALYRRKDEESEVRAAVLNTLASISDRRVVRLLRHELRLRTSEHDDDFRAQAFDALWANRHLMARPTLIGDTLFALRSDNDALVLGATLAAAELRSPRLVSALMPLMEHSWPEIRNKAVYTLGRIGDKKATKALLAHLPKVRESRMLNNIAFALERLDKKAFYQSIAALVRHKQAVIRLNAAFVLGDVRRAEGLPLLSEALKDKSDFVRASAVAAIGKLGTDEAAAGRASKLLEPLSTDPSLSLRQEAIYALHALTKGGRADLIYQQLFAKLDRRKFPAQIRRAALALGHAGDERVRGYLLGCMLGGSCSVAEVGPFLARHADAGVKGRVLLAWARRDTRLGDLLAKLRPAGTLPIASSALRDAWAQPRYAVSLSALRVLGAIGERSAMPLLRSRASTPHTWPRILSRVALARLGDGEQAAKLVAEMSNLPAEQLPGFVRALERIEEPAARGALTPPLQAKQHDRDVALGLAAAAIELRWDPDKAIFRFLDALSSKSSFERDLAERYLSHNDTKRVTWLLRRALAREGRAATRDRLRVILDERG